MPHKSNKSHKKHHKDHKSKKYRFKDIKNMEVMIIVLFIVICVVLIHSFNHNKHLNMFYTHDTSKCDIITKPVAVNSHIVDPSLEGKQHVNYFEGYYDCNHVIRGDLIVYNYAGTKVIGKVLGLPGDSFSYERDNILINGEILKNSEGEPYVLHSGMLEINGEEHKEIPEATFIILGNDPHGGNDSGKFGFAFEDNIIGKLKK